MLAPPSQMAVLPAIAFRLIAGGWVMLIIWLVFVQVLAIVTV
jgi:hypothetical protein